MNMFFFFFEIFSLKQHIRELLSAVMMCGPGLHLSVEQAMLIFISAN